MYRITFETRETSEEVKQRNVENREDACLFLKLNGVGSDDLTYGQHFTELLISPEWYGH